MNREAWGGRGDRLCGFCKISFRRCLFAVSSQVPVAGSLSLASFIHLGGKTPLDLRTDEHPFPPRGWGGYPRAISPAPLFSMLAPRRAPGGQLPSARLGGGGGVCVCVSRGEGVVWNFAVSVAADPRGEGRPPLAHWSPCRQLVQFAAVAFGARPSRNKPLA